MLEAYLVGALITATMLYRYERPVGAGERIAWAGLSVLWPAVWFVTAVGLCSGNNIWNVRH